MNYAALPPEINSTRMYSGPGSAPMRAAAAAWGALSAELQSAADGCEAVLAELTGQAWLGPAAAMMSTTVTSYIGWLAGTAARSAQTAAQADSAAAAYEAAFAMTVPPSVVAANRAQLIALVASNVLGQNTAAIAANEAHYGEMWAQDATAMFGYAASSAPAADLAPFSPPPRTADPTGRTGLSQLATAAKNALAQAVAAPAQGIEELFVLPSLSDLAGVDVVSSIGLGLSGAAWSSAEASTREILREQEQVQEVEYDILHAIDLFSPLTPSRPTGATPGLTSSISAGLGEAFSVGRISAPLSWATTAPEIRSLSYTTPLAGPTPAAAARLPLSAAGSAFSQMGLAGMGGSVLAGSVSRTQGEAAGQQRARVAQPAAGQAPAAPVDAGAAEPGPPLTGIAAEIREFAELRDRGLITSDEYNEQKMRLLGH